MMERSQDSKVPHKAKRRIISNSQNQDESRVPKRPGLAGEVMHLQQAIGNQGVMRMLNPAAGLTRAAPPGAVQREINIAPIEDDTELDQGVLDRGNQEDTANGETEQDQPGGGTTPLPPVLSPVEKLPTPPVESQDNYESLTIGEYTGNEEDI